MLSELILWNSINVGDAKAHNLSVQTRKQVILRRQTRVTKWNHSQGRYKLYPPTWDFYGYFTRLGTKWNPTRTSHQERCNFISWTCNFLVLYHRCYIGPPHFPVEYVSYLTHPIFHWWCGISSVNKYACNGHPKGSLFFSFFLFFDNGRISSQKSSSTANTWRAHRWKTKNHVFHQKKTVYYTFSQIYLFSLPAWVDWMTVGLNQGVICVDRRHAESNSASSNARGCSLSSLIYTRWIFASFLDIASKVVPLFSA